VVVQTSRTSTTRTPLPSGSACTRINMAPCYVQRSLSLEFSVHYFLVSSLHMGLFRCSVCWPRTGAENPVCVPPA
jgi:hypothetical protein